MTEIDSPTGLSEKSSQELRSATVAATGDEVADRLMGDARQLIEGVNSESHRAAGRAAALHGDDVSNPAGVARQLSELAPHLRATTEDALAAADQKLAAVETRHLEKILAHDSREDANLRFEVDNYLAGLKKEDAPMAMVRLAADGRYASFLAGPAGRSIAARFGFDAALLRGTALALFAEHGTAEQLRRFAVLATLDQQRRALGLARGGRDAVAAEAPKPPLKAMGSPTG